MAEFKETPPELAEAHPHLKDLMPFLDQLNSESERGQVLICASMLDDMLLATLRAFLRETDSATKLLDSFNAPLGTLSAKIEAAHALGVIDDDEYLDSTIIRKIRNKFAHSLTCSFADDDIKDQSANLHFKAEDYEDVVVGARGQFASAATCLILRLTTRPHYVGEQRLTENEWPY